MYSFESPMQNRWLTLNDLLYFSLVEFKVQCKIITNRFPQQKNVLTNHNFPGKYTYLTFSHNKSVLVRDFGMIGEMLGKFRYPPYTASSMATGGALLKRRNFPKIPKCVPYLACIGLGIILVITAKAIAQTLGKDLPDWM